jgi:hypothetical protein
MNTNLKNLTQTAHLAVVPQHVNLQAVLLPVPFWTVWTMKLRFHATLVFHVAVQVSSMFICTSTLVALKMPLIRLPLCKVVGFHHWVKNLRKQVTKNIPTFLRVKHIPMQI